MSEKKRKRESHGKSERAHKKIAITSSDTVNVTLLQNVSEWTPLLGSYHSSLEQ